MHLLLLLLVLLLFLGKGLDELVMKLINVGQLDALARLHMLLA